MIGSGQYVRLQMWDGDEVVHDGVLDPGADCNLRFSEGPQSVTRFALTRITKAEADALASLEDADTKGGTT